MVKKWGERQAEVLQLLSRFSDGMTPQELSDEVGISQLLAGILLSRYKGQGLLQKRRSQNGCRYCISSKGERKRAYLEVVEAEKMGSESRDGCNCKRPQKEAKGEAAKLAGEYNA